MSKICARCLDLMSRDRWLVSKVCERCSSCADTWWVDKRLMTSDEQRIIQRALRRSVEIKAAGRAKIGE